MAAILLFGDDVTVIAHAPLVLVVRVVLQSQIRHPKLMIRLVDLE